MCRSWRLPRNRGGGKKKEFQKQKWPATSRRGDRMILQYQYICARYIKAATRPQQGRRTPEKINCRVFSLFFGHTFPSRSKYADSLRCGFHTTGATRSSSFPGKTDVGVCPFVRPWQDRSGRGKYLLNVFIQTPEGSASHGETCDQRLDPPPPAPCTTRP